MLVLFLTTRTHFCGESLNCSMFLEPFLLRQHDIHVWFNVFEVLLRGHENTVPPVLCLRYLPEWMHIHSAVEIRLYSLPLVKLKQNKVTVTHFLATVPLQQFQIQRCRLPRQRETYESINKNMSLVLSKDSHIFCCILSSSWYCFFLPGSEPYSISFSLACPVHIFLPLIISRHWLHCRYPWIHTLIILPELMQ